MSCCTFLAGYLALCLSGCPFPSSGTFPIRVTAERITLEWDPPAVQFPSPPLDVSQYRIYYRVHGSMAWSFIAEIRATPSPSFSIRHSDLGDGTFDFAVSAVSSSGHESSPHSSLDSTAIPRGGWCLDWVGGAPP